MYNNKVFCISSPKYYLWQKFDKRFMDPTQYPSAYTSYTETGKDHSKFLHITHWCVTLYSTPDVSRWKHEIIRNYHLINRTKIESSVQEVTSFCSYSLSPCYQLAVPERPRLALLFWLKLHSILVTNIWFSPEMQNKFVCTLISSWFTECNK